MAKHATAAHFHSDEGGLPLLDTTASNSEKESYSRRRERAPCRSIERLEREKGGLKGGKLSNRKDGETISERGSS
jgi:hypothetical protein